MEKPIYIPPLSSLLNEAACLWNSNRQLNETYEFTLGKFPSGWCFKVIDSWNNWMDKKLKVDFAGHATPEDAVVAFLQYVRENRIDVASLQEH